MNRLFTLVGFLSILALQRLVLAALVTLFMCNSAPAGDGPATTQSHSESSDQYDPIWDNRINATDDWFIWAHFIKNPLTGNSTDEVQYFCQTNTDHRPALIADVKGDSGRLRSITRLSDGTLLVLATGEHHWTVPGRVAEINTRPLLDHSLFPLVFYPDGLLAATYNGSEGLKPVPILWIPLHDQKLDLNAEVELQKDFVGTRFLRHGDEIAWGDQTRTGTRPDPGPRTRKLRIFNAAKLTSRDVDLPPDEFGQGVLLSGFDGVTAFDGTHLIDVKTGRTTTITSINAIGLVDGVVYSVNRTDDGLELVATPIQKPSESRVIHRIPKSSLLPAKWPMPWNTLDPTRFYFVGEKAIHVWDGNAWQTIVH